MVNNTALSGSSNATASEPEYYENIYPYAPSLALALFTAAFFAIVTFLNTYQIIRSKAWCFIAFVLGAYFESIGFLIRAFSIQQRPKHTLQPFAASLVLLLVAPALFAASIYMFLGRIIRLVKAEHHAIIRIGWLTKIFVLGDVVSFAVQAIGAVVLSQQTEDLYTKGSNIMTNGLAVQTVFFVVFLAVAVLFHFRTNRNPTDRSRHPEIPWRRHMRMFYASSAIILVRCLFRFIQYRTNSPTEAGYLLSHEWPMYVFDALFMLIVMILLFAKHPSEIIALRLPTGGIAMKYLSGRRAGPVNESWKVLPQPVLGPKMMYEAGDKMVMMTRHAPRGVQVAAANRW